MAWLAPLGVMDHARGVLGGSGIRHARLGACQRPFRDVDVRIDETRRHGGVREVDDARSRRRGSQDFRVPYASDESIPDQYRIWWCAATRGAAAWGAEVCMDKTGCEQDFL
jgi:hypothetical protein